MTRLISVVAGWRGYALTAAIMLAIGFASGWTVRDWKASADTASARVHAAEVRVAAIRDALDRERDQTDITTAVDGRATAEQTRIRTVTQTIIKEVPVYVPAEADLRYALPVGLVRLHDAAATGTAGRPFSYAPGQPDDPAGFLEPSDVAPSRLGTVIAENYGVCHADAARFSALQDWVRQQQAAMNAP